MLSCARNTRSEAESYTPENNIYNNTVKRLNPSFYYFLVIYNMMGSQ
jgi:hypothetical protein